MSGRQPRVELKPHLSDAITFLCELRIHRHREGRAGGEGVRNRGTGRKRKRKKEEVIAD